MAAAQIANVPQAVQTPSHGSGGTRQPSPQKARFERRPDSGRPAHTTNLHRTSRTTPQASPQHAPRDHPANRLLGRPPYLRAAPSPFEDSSPFPLGAKAVFFVASLNFKRKEVLDAGAGRVGERSTAGASAQPLSPAGITGSKSSATGDGRERGCRSGAGHCDREHEGQDEGSPSEGTASQRGRGRGERAEGGRGKSERSCGVGIYRWQGPAVSGRGAQDAGWGRGGSCAARDRGERWKKSPRKRLSVSPSPCLPVSLSLSRAHTQRHAHPCCLPG